MSQENRVLFPVGRIVQGDLYAMTDKDNQGNPLLIKNGANKGQPYKRNFFAVAIPKTPGATHWAQESWGAPVWALGHSWWATIADRATGQLPKRFAWKIEDGDSNEPNQNNRRNCDNEGFPGHWVVKFGSSYPPKVFDENAVPLLQEGLVKRGYWVEVEAGLASNENTQNPGIYINPSMVAYRAPGKEIVSGPDPKSVGFGRSALPAGVTAQPMGNTATLPASTPAPTTTPPAPAASAPAPTVAAPAPTAVTPSPSFIAPPVANAAPPVAPAVPPAAPAAAAFVCPLGAPTGYKMANAAGARYEAFTANGWTNEAMLTGGHMVKL